MRYITADYIFPISSPPIKNGVVVIDADGTIQNILPLQPETSTAPALSIVEGLSLKTLNLKLETLNFNLETHKGIICPGFINTHCHLELSHMKGAIPEKLGMAGFIKNMLAKRLGHNREHILEAINTAEQEMITNGIVAVGDISNDDSTFEQKSKGNLKHHTFFEVFDVNPSRANEVFEKALELNSRLRTKDSRLKSSITPHSSYTVSETLFKLIRKQAQQNNSIISYHNEESLAESELFISKSGTLAEFFTGMGINLNYIPKTGLNSLRSTLQHFSPDNKLLLVHNTYTSKEDILWAMTYFEGQGMVRQAHHKARDEKNVSNLFWCFCPNANLYIENKLPDIDSFISTKATCTLGTDSLASNKSLSILDEMKTITQFFPHIDLQQLLIWGTLNGALFMGLEKELGSLEVGKRPGLNLISNINLKELQLTPDSKVEKLL